MCGRSECVRGQDPAAQALWMLSERWAAGEREDGGGADYLNLAKIHSQ